MVTTGHPTRHLMRSRWVTMVTTVGSRWVTMVTTASVARGMLGGGRMLLVSVAVLVVLVVLAGVLVITRK